MEWNQLQKFMVVAKEENFSKAAEILNMTQPSLSQAIKRLEEELGYQLFLRNGKKISLNESGRIFLQTVIQMNELMQNTRVQLEELNRMRHPNVSIHFATASKVLPELLLYLKKRNPETQYHIHQWQSEKDWYEDDIQVLSGGLGNTAYIELNKQVDMREKGIDRHLGVSEILMSEKILLALPRNHVLLNREKITLNDLVQEEFISLNEYWKLGREIKEAMERISFVPKSTMIVDNPNMMRELLKARLGIAFIPSVSWDAFAGDEIVLRPVEGIELSRYIYLHTKPRKYLTKEQKECIQGIKEFFADKQQEYYERLGTGQK